MQKTLNPPVPLVMDESTALALFALSVLSLLRLSKELLGIQHTVPSEEEGEWINEDGKIQWPIGLSEYFSPITGLRQRPQLRRGNPADTQISKFILSCITRSIETIAGAVGERFEESPFGFFRVVQNQIQIKEARPLSEVMKGINYSFADSRTRMPVKISFRDISFAVSSQKVGQQNISVVKRNMSILVKSIEGWVSDVRPKDTVAINLKDFPGVKPSYGEAWIRRHSELDSNLRAEFNFGGLFQIIREARGPITNDQQDTNLIIRDILWVRSLCKELDEQAITDMDYKGKGIERTHGSPLGFYHSVMEAKIYEVKRIVVRDGVLMVEGLALFDNEKISKTLCMHLPRFDDGSLNFSMGTLMGATTQQLRTGAWTITAVRPEMTPYERDLVELRLAIYADTLLSLDRTEYNRSINGLRVYFESLRIGGILSSDFLIRNGSGTEFHKMAVVIENAFRAVFKTIKEHRVNSERYRDDMILEATRDGVLDLDRVKDVLLRVIEQQSSFAICPVSALKADLRPEEAFRLREAVKKLAIRSAAIFGTYEEYRNWCDGLAN